MRGDGTLGFTWATGQCRTTRATTSRDREGAGATQAACVELPPGLQAITGGRSWDGETVLNLNI